MSLWGKMNSSDYEFYSHYWDVANNETLEATQDPDPMWADDVIYYEVVADIDTGDCCSKEDDAS